MKRNLRGQVMTEAVGNMDYIIGWPKPFYNLLGLSKTIYRQNHEYKENEEFYVCQMLYRLYLVQYNLLDFVY